MKKNSKNQNPRPKRWSRQSSTLSETEVKHIAKLAKLKLTKQEVKMFCSQLSEVLGYMKVLNEVKTKNVEPTAQVTGLENVFREDKTFPSLKPNQALSCAPKRKGNFFKTQVVLEK